MARVYLNDGLVHMIADHPPGGWPDTRARSGGGEPGRDPQRPLSHRLLWFVGLWIVGVGILAAISLIIKLMLGH